MQAGENIVYRNFKESVRYLKKIKRHFWISLVLFFGFGLFGFIFPVFFVEQVRQMIEEIIKQTAGLSTLGLIRFIIFNNVKSAFFGLIFGLFFAIIPLGILIINGYVLGFVASKSASSEGLLILWRLLPHGILEIPAVLISVALGIRLGTFLFIYQGKNKWKEFKKWIWDSLKVFILIVIPLLVIAGIIEGVLIGVVG